MPRSGWRIQPVECAHIRVERARGGSSNASLGTLNQILGTLNAIPGTLNQILGTVNAIPGTLDVGLRRCTPHGSSARTASIVSASAAVLSGR